MRLLLASFALTLALIGWWLLPVATTSLPERPNDSLLNLAILSWGAPLDAPFGALESRSLARTETLWGILPFFAAMRWMGEPLAYNLTMFVSFALSLAAMAWLVRTWTGSLTAGLIAGVAYAMAPCHYLEIERIQLEQGCWIPLTLLAWERLPRWRGALLAGLLMAAQFLACVYLFFQLLWVLGVWTLVARSKEPWLRLAASLGLALLLLSPILSVYLEMQQRWPNDRGTLSVLTNYCGTPIDLVRTHRGNLVWGSVLGTPNERGLFPGLAVLALAVLGLMKGSRKIQLGVLLVLAFVLYQGPNLNVNGVSLWGLLSHLPGYAIQRAPTRYHFLFAFAVAALAGLGAGQLRGRWRCAALVVVALEALVRVPMTPLPEVPKIYNCVSGPLGLRGVWHKGPLLELPLFPDLEPLPFPEARRLYFSTLHRRRLVNSYPMVASPLVFELALFTHKGPDPALHDILLSVGVNTVVVHRAEMTPAEAALWQPSPGWILGLESGPDQVWYVVPPALWTTSGLGAARFSFDPIGPLPATEKITIGLRIQGKPDTLAYRTPPGLATVNVSWGKPARVLLPHWVLPTDDFVNALALTTPGPGNYTLTLQGDGWSASAPALIDAGVTYGPPDHLQLTLAPINATKVTATLKNNGSTALRAGSLAHLPGQEVWLSRRWDDGPELPPLPLRADLPPGKETTLTLNLPAPATPGRHTLHVGLENGRELGSLTLELRP